MAAARKKSPARTAGSSRKQSTKRKKKTATRAPAGKKKNSAKQAARKTARKAPRKKSRPRVVPTGSFRIPAAAENTPAASNAPDPSDSGFPEDLSPVGAVAQSSSGAARAQEPAPEDWGDLHDHEQPAADDVQDYDDSARFDGSGDPDADEADGDGYMSVGDHLEELRQRFFWMMGIVGTFAVAAGIFSGRLHEILIEPYIALTGENLILMNIYGPMEIFIKVSVLAGVVLGFPFLIFILWGFVTPAVSRKAAWLGRFAVACSALLFWTGIAVAWFYVFPLSLEFFLVDWQMAGVASVLSVERFYSFLFTLHFAAGLAFQLPIILIALGALGILTVAWHARTWRVSLVTLLVSSAIITPPDPWSMLGVGGLLIILYGFSVAVVWLIERARGKRDAALS